MLRPLLAIALLSTSILAGCADESDDPVTPIVDPVREPIAFADDVALPQLQGAGEPNIAILPDGTLFVTAPVGGSMKPNVMEGSAYLWRSTDGGATWEVLRSPDILPMENPLPINAGLFCSCDADVTTSPDGLVYYTDWWIAGLAPGNYLVEASADGGDSWTANSLTIPQNLVAGMDRQWLVAGEDGFVAIFYSFFSSIPCAVIVCVTPPIPAFGLDRPGQAIEAVYSFDHGETWSEPNPVVPASNDGLQIGHPRIAADGTLWMPYGAVPPGDTFWRDESEVRVAVSKDQGATWTQNKVADAPEGFDNLWAVQGASDSVTGRSSVAWAARVDDDHSAVWLANSEDLTSWSVPYPVDGLGINVLPWVAAWNGTVTVGWYGSSATGDPLEVSGSTEWYALSAQWDGIGTAPTAAHMPIAYVSDEPVKTGPMCPRGAACTSDRELLDYVSMEYAPDGNVHYAFARSQGGNAFVHTAAQSGYELRPWPDI